jgi:hypothetical protein
MVALPSMTSRVVIAGLVLAAFLLATPAARAQTVELGIFGGYGFGGALVSTVGFQDIPIDSGVVYGGTAAVGFAHGWRFEAMVSRRESEMRVPKPGGRVAVNVERFMGGVQQEESAGPVLIFGAFMLGATRFVPAGSGSDTWFTLGVGAGVKTLVSRHVGFRFEARGFYTPVTVSGRVYCGFSACLFDYTGSGIFQGDVSAGLVVRF